MANGLCSLPLISTPFWANRYVPLSVALEHFALEAFSSSANPLPTASTPTRPTTPNTTNRAARYLFMRSLPPCFVVAYDRISVSTPTSSRAGPHITSAAYSCERGRRITQMSDFCWCLNVAYRQERIRTPFGRSSQGSTSRHSGEAFSTVGHPPKLGHIGQTVDARGFAYANRCTLQPLVARRCRGRGF